MNKFYDTIAVIIISILCVLFFYFIVIMLPFAMIKEDMCYSNGYAKSHVTFNFNHYCSNLDGSITVKMVKQ